jgi:hypothetical protein
MIKFKDIAKLIIERDQSSIKSLAKHVSDKLLPLKDKFLECESTIDAIDLMNDAVQKYNVEFVMGDIDGNPATYGDVGIYGGSVDIGGNITIYVFDDLIDIIDQYYFITFVRIVKTILTHELTHVNQLDKSGDKFKASSDATDNYEYLSNVHEIMAHANEAMDDLMSNNYSKADVLQLLRNPKNSKISQGESEAWWKYWNHFYDSEEQNDTWKRFLKYCYQYLEEYD